MKNYLHIQVRSFPIVVQDMRTGKEGKDTVVLHKQQLQAAQLVGESSKELITRLYNRKGFRVLHIGKPVREEVTIELTSYYRTMYELREISENIKTEL